MGAGVLEVVLLPSPFVVFVLGRCSVGTFFFALVDEYLRIGFFFELRLSELPDDDGDL